MIWRDLFLKMLSWFVSRRWAFYPFCFFAFLFVAFYVGVQTKPVMIIEATTRSLNYETINPLESRINFPFPVLLKKSLRDKGTCIQGVLEPALGTKVNFTISNNILIIRLSSDETRTGYMYVKGSSDDPYAFDNNDAIWVSQNSACEKGNISTLSMPIWGVTEIGKIPAAATLAGNSDLLSGVLLQGKVTLFGRNGLERGIYPAGEVTLPVGARLSSVSVDGTYAPAWGYALFSPHHVDENGLASLSVYATTEAEELLIKRMASGPEPEVIKLSALSHIAGSPLFIYFGTAITALFVLSEFLIALAELLKRRNHEK